MERIRQINKKEIIDKQHTNKKDIIDIEHTKKMEEIKERGKYKVDTEYTDKDKDNEGNLNPWMSVFPSEDENEEIPSELSDPNSSMDNLNAD